MTSSSKSGEISISSLRNVLLISLVVAVGVLAVSVTLLVDSIFANFGPGVKQDLEWKTVRGARELSKVSDLGLAIGDAEMVSENFADYVASDDVVAIVAVGTEGNVVARHGETSWPVASLFEGEAGKIREVDEHFVSWNRAEIEGGEVGRVALVVTERRLIESQALLQQIKVGTIFVAFASLVLGSLVVLFFARLVAKRDAQLAEYAATLEQKVEQRTEELRRRNEGMRLVLDNVQDGFITIGMDGVMESERSSVVDHWFGKPEPDMDFGAYVGRADADAAEWFQIGMDGIRDGFMPLDVLLDQLPKVVEMGDRNLRISYVPIRDNGELHRILVVIRDVTQKLRREKMETEQRELVAVFERIMRDRNGFIDFLREARDLEKQIVEDEALPTPVAKRLIHTLKGNSGFFGLTTVAKTCHAIEDRLQEAGGDLEPQDRADLRRVWKTAEKRIESLMGDADRPVMEIDAWEYERLRERVMQGAELAEIDAILAAWELDPVQKRLEQLKDQGLQLAKRLGKKNIEFEIDGGGVRLESNKWSHFWSNMTHAIRNAIDHGMETAEQRQAAGKSEAGLIRLTARQDDDVLFVALEDDGRGIDWDAIQRKTQAAGIAADATQDLVEALFTDGISSKESASMTSGRGVGMSALREAVGEHGGTIRVDSEPNRGTRFLFEFPNTVGVTMTVDLQVTTDHRAPVHGRRTKPAMETDERPRA